ncbi:hypothetical protein [Saccharothrix sp. HUAS TT1]|uniref:hypothetical protein n=1 Tax=unclassified Saccharothrix TaxID=2593673 RepID=UPI00345C0034
MTSVAGRAVRWVSDEPFPGCVEVQLTDVHGVVWSLFDKPPIFDGADPLTPDAAYPVDVQVSCEVIGREGLPDGAEVLTISTRRPWGIETPDGRTEFQVNANQVTTS